MKDYPARIARWDELKDYAKGRGLSANAAINEAIGQMLDRDREIERENGELREKIVAVAMGRISLTEKD